MPDSSFKGHLWKWTVPTAEANDQTISANAWQSESDVLGAANITAATANLTLTFENWM